MPWIVTGNCNHCGDCCKPPVIINNPCISPSEDRCKFWDDDIDETVRFGHCLIMKRGNKPIKKVKDRFGAEITQEQIDWFNVNCPTYPILIELVRGMSLPSSCAFTIEEVS